MDFEIGDSFVVVLEGFYKLADIENNMVIHKVHEIYGDSVRAEDGYDYHMDNIEKI